MDSPENQAARARSLRAHADWCISMAAKVDHRMFRTYVDAAAVFQREALALEGRAEHRP